MRFYAVIDTNVLVSSFLVDNSNPKKILDAVHSGTIVPLVNNEILREYEEVLSRDKFTFKKELIEKQLKFFREYGLFLDRTKTEEEFIDSEDVVFYEITLSGRLKFDAYLVTGNIKHFPKKTFAVTPKEMLDIINSN